MFKSQLYTFHQEEKVKIIIIIIIIIIILFKFVSNKIKST